MSQCEALLDLLSDGEPHSTFEIVREVYKLEHAGVCRVGARIFELRRKGFDIYGRRDEKIKGLYWYRLIGDKSAPLGRVVQASGEAPTTPFQKDLFAEVA